MGNCTTTKIGRCEKSRNKIGSKIFNGILMEMIKKMAFPVMEMAVKLVDENNLRALPDEERFTLCVDILKNEKDESKRWDAVWLIGELAENRKHGDQLFDKVSEAIEWVIKYDNNGVVKHEACFQIAARNMRQKIPVLVDAALHDKSVLSRHEAIEALGLMRAFEAEPLIKQALKDSSIDVRETAEFVLKRFNRLREQGEYKPYEIL
jgi:HEAT repeat protein